MYKKVDDVLSENSSDNYFFDDEFIYVRELLNEFTEDDWLELVQSLKDKGNNYKIRLAYCIDGDTGMSGLDLLLELVNESDEVAEYALDSLRSFDKEPYKTMIRSNVVLTEKAEKLLENASLPVKQMLEAFLQQNK